MAAIPVVSLSERDVPAVLAIERECFSLPWSEAQLRGAFARQEFTAFGLGALSLLGYISLYHTAGEVEILNIAVLAAHRRQGHGARLLRHALQRMEKMDMQRVVLEVRKGNVAARALYARMGFTEAGLRKGYYADTGEDALVLALEFATLA